MEARDEGMVRWVEIEELAMVSAIVFVSAMVSVSFAGEEVRKKEGSGMVGCGLVLGLGLSRALRSEYRIDSRRIVYVCRGYVRLAQCICLYRVCAVGATKFVFREFVVDSVQVGICS